MRRSHFYEQLPEYWKTSLVISIFKSKSRYDPLNYRPVSLTSVSCKTMENLSYSILNYLEANSLIMNTQFGFRKNHPTENQLLITYEHIFELVDAGMMVDFVLLDFSKAFDVVCRTILLKQLAAVGISHTLIVWIEAFLVS